MASNGKLIIKIFIGFIILTTLMVFGFFFFLYKAVDNSIEENRRVEALPNIKSVIYSENNTVAPISGDSVAFYFLKYSAVQHSSPTSSSSTSRKQFYPLNNELSIKVGSSPFSLRTTPYMRIAHENKIVNEKWRVALTLAFNDAPDLPPNLLGVNDDLDCLVAKAYEDNWDLDIGIDLGCSNWDCSSVEIEEYTWKKGDSISFKGELIDGEIDFLW